MKVGDCVVITGTNYESPFLAIGETGRIIKCYEDIHGNLYDVVMHNGHRDSFGEDDWPFFEFQLQVVED